MRRKLFLVLLVLCVLLLASCTVGSRVYSGQQTTNFFDGTDGLVVDFLAQAPPSEVFETSEFDVQLYVRNKGAFSIIDPYMVLVDLTFDSSKVELLTGYTGDGLTEGSRSFLETVLSDTGSSASSANSAGGAFVIEGKNLNWLTGEEQYISLARLKAKEITGNFQTNTVSFIAQLCYPYQTTFTSEVCIDTDTQGTSQRDEVCEKRDESYSGGQGAPVAITAVESQMIPRGVYVQPQFTIHLSHVGKGVVSYRDINSQEYDSDQCRDIPSDDINRISVNAMLGGDTLNCLPNEVILQGGEAKIQCQLAQDNILGVSTNYETTLVVNLGYQYSESFRKDIVVQKSEGVNFENLQTTDPSDCYAWQTLDSATQKCINTCDFKAKYQQEFFTNTDIAQAMNLELAEEVDAEYLWSQVSCNYRGSVSCKDNPRLCLLQNDLCPPGDFCGLPECLLRNTPPSITNRIKIGTDRISFYCSDGDDALNIKQTCGCTEEMFYGFIDKTETCVWPDSYTQTKPGTRENIFGIQHNIDGISDEDKKDKRLCILVKDKLNANSTLSLTYPFE